MIWHTQGSGKSLTMLYTAYKLRKTEALADPTVFIVVDRKDLKDQMGDTFFDCEFPNARIVLSVGDLKSILRDKPAGVFITTIQKFRELGEIKDERGNVVVLIDEAHRTEYGDYQMELRAVTRVFWIQSPEFQNFPAYCQNLSAPVPPVFSWSVFCCFWS